MFKRLKNPNKEMPFLDHLEELRWRIFWIILAVIIGSVAGFILVLQFGVLEILLAPLENVLGEGEKLKFFSPTEPFFLILKIGVLVGIILVFPVITYQIWSFFAPALKRHEKRVIIPGLYMGMVLFMAGVAMSYLVALPVTLRFLLFFGEEYWDPILQAGPYLSFVTKLLVAFGVLFELPVVIMIFSVMGLVTPAFLRKKRRHAIVIITVLASFLSPGDVVTVTVMMMVPLVLLYEFSIFLSVLIYRRREKDIGGGPPEGSVEAE